MFVVLKLWYTGTRNKTPGDVHARRVENFDNVSDGMAHAKRREL
jgi:hypothetical protein